METEYQPKADNADSAVLVEGFFRLGGITPLLIHRVYVFIHPAVENTLLAGLATFRNLSTKVGLACSDPEKHCSPTSKQSKLPIDWQSACGSKMLHLRHMGTKRDSLYIYIYILQIPATRQSLVVQHTHRQ